ncbi:MAG: hypothetical protein K0S33_4294 [Bacteroidetes bacterium]|jgi:hypothetical protein|nr:hypothetical protein [Bacteroidota bacterium]
MSTEEFIALARLCEYHETELSFFKGLHSTGLIEIHTIEEAPYIHRDRVRDLEKMIRLHRELDINAEGIDTIFNLLHRIEELQQELDELRGRIRL